MCKPCRNGKEAWGVYPGVGGALLLQLFCWQCMHVVCAREKEGRLKGLCLLHVFYELGLYVGFLWVQHALLIVTASSVIPTLTHTEVWAPLNPVLIACHRFKRTQADALWLPEILISKYALSWPPCDDKLPEPGLKPRPPEPWLKPRPLEPGVKSPDLQSLGSSQNLQSLGSSPDHRSLAATEAKRTAASDLCHLTTKANQCTENIILQLFLQCKFNYIKKKSPNQQNNIFLRNVSTIIF